MKNTIKLYITQIIVFAFIFISCSTVWASNSANFSVVPRLPSNQREGSGYFDLKMEPGQQQEITITVQNTGAENISVQVETITASTGSNGEINYSSPGNMDETLPFSFADIAELEADNYEIAAQSSVDIPIKITMPEEKFDGIVLGSIRVLKGLSEEDKNSKQTLVNQYAYVIAVKLYEEESVIEPDFTIKDVVAGTVNYRAAIIANICNPKNMNYKGAAVNVQIFPKGDDTPIFEIAKDTVDFAPNSIYNLALTDEAGYGINAGDYIAKINLTYEGKDWNFEEPFTVLAEKAAAVNSSALNQVQQRQTAGVGQQIPMWVIILIVVLVIILAVLIILVLLTIKKMNREKKLNRKEIIHLEKDDDSNSN